MQTFDDRVRQSVMRVDGRDAILSRLDKLISYDEAAVVIDLIYGFPWQTMEVWEDDIRTAQSLKLDGVDCYQLNVFEKSPLAKYIANGKLPPAADTAMKADMFALSVERFTNAQWRRLSNNHWGKRCASETSTTRLVKAHAIASLSGAERADVCKATAS